MGKTTEYLKGRGEQKIEILTYLKKRRDYILKMMAERQKKMHNEVKCCELEALFTYNAIMSDIKHDRLEM